MSELKRYGHQQHNGKIWFEEREDGKFCAYDDYAELKAQLDALAAENAELIELYRRAVKELDDTCFETGMVRGEKSMEYPAPETPATDAYLNSLRAEGVEMFAKHQNSMVGMPNKSDAALRYAARAAILFAAQLRAGKDGE